ncbi:MAG: hypothetical protein AAFY11_06305 [Cyanobacteria bacterium J06641_5]
MEFAVCIDNQDYPAALETRKIYQILPDPTANQRQFLRVIDESGEDYLYPAHCFAAIELPEAVKQAFALAS